jgi:signal peptidase I
LKATHLSFQKIRHSEYVKSAVVIVVIVGVVLGLFFGLGLVLGSPVPVRVVESGSMCVPYGAACQGLKAVNQPFAHTLHTGDLIIVQGVNPKDLNTNYPNSDIIVYLNPDNPTATPIVHRIVAVNDINGTLYFQTKGDGNGDKWPAVPSPSEYDSVQLWQTGGGVGVPQSMVEGKVVMRIPYVGWITLLLKQNQWGLPAIVAVILLLVVLEFVIPIIRKSAKTPQAQSSSEVKDNA